MGRAIDVLEKELKSLQEKDLERITLASEINCSSKALSEVIEKSGEDIANIQAAIWKLKNYKLIS